jgi:uncharacterized protein YkwD
MVAEVRSSMKSASFFPSLVFSLALFFAFSAQINAQIAAVNYRSMFGNDEKSVTATMRPRIISAGAETKTTNGAIVTAAMIADCEQQAFHLINDKRRAQNLPPLKWNDDVARAARAHSQNMAEYKFLSHQGTDGSMVDDRADRVGLNKWRAIGENIAYNRGYAQPIEFAVESWMESPKHKQNLLDTRWQESAIGIAVTPDGTYYLTQVFLLRK